VSFACIKNAVERNKRKSRLSCYNSRIQIQLLLALLADKLIMAECGVGNLIREKSLIKARSTLWLFSPAKI